MIFIDQQSFLEIVSPRVFLTCGRIVYKRMPAHNDWYADFFLKTLHLYYKAHFIAAAGELLKVSAAYCNKSSYELCRRHHQ